MWDILLNFGGVVVLAVFLGGAALSFVLFHKFIGPEASLILGLLVAAYPAYLAFRKIEG